jgi:hypothetical protein
MTILKAHFRATIVASLILAAACPAGATDPETRAKAHYERALQLFDEGSYPAALREFQRADELRPSYKLLYFIAQAQAAMNDPAAALVSYRKYLDQGGQRITPELRQEVSDEMTEIGRRVSVLTVSADVAGAEVWVDDTRVGVTPLRAPLVINAGGHRISLRYADRPPQLEVVNLAGGTSGRVEFKGGTSTPASSRAPDVDGARRDASAAPGTPLPEHGSELHEAPAAQGDWWQEHAWLGWVVTGTLGAGAIGTGLWAMSDDNALSRQRREAATGGVDRAELESSASRVRTLATVTDILWIATVAAGGVNLWLTYGRETPELPAETARAEPLRLSVGLSGVSLEGNF